MAKKVMTHLLAFRDKLKKNVAYKIGFIFIVLTMLTLLIISQNVSRASIKEQLATYQLVWSDEFNDSALDTTKWRYRYLGPRHGGVNVKETVSFDEEGYLRLSTNKVDDKYHTAMIGTQGTYQAKYGYFEARIKLQQQVGHWSAFWLQSPKYSEGVGSTAIYGAEVDIFEYLQKEGNTIRHALHWDGYKEDHKSKGKRVDVEGVTKGWHTVGLLWTKDSYTFYIDGQETWHTSKAVSNRSQYIVLSLEVGKWAGQISEANLPDSFMVDYVRVYQKRP
jgi:beta-glucanase (GH16 family)